MVNCLFVAFGGALGSVARYLLTLLPLRGRSGFPINTLLVNIVGAFVLGLLSAIAVKQADFNPELRLFLTVGLCGGFTTFSTFSQETVTLFEQGKGGLGVLYLSLSLSLGLLAVFLAHQLVK